MYETTFFSEVLLEARPLLGSDAPILVTVDARMENDVVRLLAQRVQSLDEAVALK